MCTPRESHNDPRLELNACKAGRGLVAKEHDLDEIRT